MQSMWKKLIPSRIKVEAETNLENGIIYLSAMQRDHRSVRVGCSCRPDVSFIYLGIGSKPFSLVEKSHSHSREFLHRKKTCQSWTKKNFLALSLEQRKHRTTRPIRYRANKSISIKGLLNTIAQLNLVPSQSRAFN